MAMMHNLDQSTVPQIQNYTSASNIYNGIGARTQNNALPENNLGRMLPMDLNANLLGNQKKKKESVNMTARRLIKVIIVDPDDKVPLNKCILYTGEEKLTDLTDQELFFEIDIKNTLEEHNKTRIGIIDKSVKERVEHLEPIKVRDLRMVVVTVASF